jgi:oligosaccharide repeat unit polymerase
VASSATTIQPPRSLIHEVRSEHPGFALAFLIFSWGTIVVTALAVSETVLRGGMISAVATAIILPLFYRVATNSFDLFEPVVPSALATGVMFVGRPIADQAMSSYIHLGYNILPTFDWTLLNVLVGVIFFNMGYSSSLGRSLQKLFPTPAKLFPPSMVAIGAATMSIVGASLFGIFLIGNGGARAFLIMVSGRSHAASTFTRHSTGYLYEAINLFLPATLVFFALWVRTKRAGYLCLAASTATPLFLYQASMGDRCEMLPLIFGLPAVYYLWKSRRPRFSSLLAAGLCLLFAFAFLREFRNSAAAGRQNLGNAVILSDPGKALASTFTKDDSEMFDTFCNLVSVVPSSLAFHPFGVITDVAVRALPRVLFPDKPLELPDQLIVILWPQHYRLSRASAASSIFGNFYLYGGVVGVAIGAFVMGMVLRQVWLWYLNHHNNLNAIVLYSLVPALLVVLWRGTVTGTLGMMFFTALPLLVMQPLIRLRGSHQHSTKFAEML